MSVYLRAKFEVSSLALTGLRRGNFTPSSNSRRTPKMPTQLGIKGDTEITLLEIINTGQ